MWVRMPAAPYQRCKNGTSSSLADARIKGVVLGRKSKAGRYLLKDIVMSQ